MVRGPNWDVTRELTDLKCASEGEREKEADRRV